MCALQSSYMIEEKGGGGQEGRGAWGLVVGMARVTSLDLAQDFTSLRLS